MDKKDKRCLLEHESINNNISKGGYVENNFFSQYERDFFYLRMITSPNSIYNGGIMSKFSIGNGKHIVFSQGNLQYRPITNEWRFSDNQYDYVGGEYWKEDEQGKVFLFGNTGTVYCNGEKCDNTNANNKDYGGYIDLFCYGANNVETNEYISSPTMFTGVNADYCPYSFTDRYECDFGYNKIQNGANKVGIWRSLSNDEWKNIVTNRFDESGNLLYTIGRVKLDNGDYVNGEFLFPDNWSDPQDIDIVYSELTPALIEQVNGYITSTNHESNTFDLTTFSKLESLGVVFIPCAGTLKYDKSKSFSKNGLYLKNTTNDTCYTAYWGAKTFPNGNSEWFVYNGHMRGENSSFTYFNNHGRAVAKSVRLVRDVVE